MTSSTVVRQLRIEYQGGRIILIGDVCSIHDEADRIVRQFRFSGRPYELSQESQHRVVLSPAVPH